jgi:hypothetical protein
VDVANLFLLRKGASGLPPPVPRHVYFPDELLAAKNFDRKMRMHTSMTNAPSAKQYSPKGIHSATPTGQCSGANHIQNMSR